jgi:nucleotide-binding universal stress UspA family protein
MFRRILVPLDGSTRAEQALLIAARLARASGGSLFLVRVVPSPIKMTQQAVASTTRMRETSDAGVAGVPAASDYLARLAASALLAGIATESEVITGVPAEAIIAATRSWRADILVLCSHGYSGMTRWALGSVAEKVAFHSPIPVLVLREGGPQPDAELRLRVLAGLDGSTRAEEVLAPAAYVTAALVPPARGALHLMRVVQPLVADQQEDGPYTNAIILQQASNYLDATVDRLRKGPLAPVLAGLLSLNSSVALDADVASAIIQEAEYDEEAARAGMAEGCTIIALATHGLGGIGRWVVGSITARVLKASRLPVLIVRPVDIMERSDFTWDQAQLFPV